MHRPGLLALVCMFMFAGQCTGIARPSTRLIAEDSLCACTKTSTSQLLAEVDCPKGYILHTTGPTSTASAQLTAQDPAYDHNLQHPVQRQVQLACCIPRSCMHHHAVVDMQNSVNPDVQHPHQHQQPGQQHVILLAQQTAFDVLPAQPNGQATYPASKPPGPRPAPPPTDQHAMSEAGAGPASDWMTQCCSTMLLRQMFLPGSHDTGTYMWTTPKHMPLVLDEVLSILFNIVGDLSRTQRMDVYEQLQAGARVLDIRLAINPWIAVQARAQHASALHSQLSRRESTTTISITAPSATSNGALLSWLSTAVQAAVVAVRKAVLLPAQQQAHVSAQPRLQRAQQQLYQLDPVSLEGRLNWQAAGGLLSDEERRACIVTSHSLPGAPLTTVLRDIRRFLAENPGELLVLLVKADTIDVNVAGSLRFTQQDWAAAAEVFEQELAGVQLVDEQQVQMLTLGQLAEGSRGGGSVLLYSSELRKQNMTAVSPKKASILESWGNGTNTEDLSDLKHRMLKWLSFWQLANWRQNSKPFLLLASAETTLGVRTILTMVKNRIWRWQRMAQQQLRQPTGISSKQQRRLLRALAQWQQLQAAHPGSAQSKGQAAEWSMQQAQQQLLQQQSRLTSGLTTLYQLGVETNQQMMQDVLGNYEVPKEFNVWSLDALSPKINNYIISLNNPLKPS